MGRFITRDTFGGIPGGPASLNRYNYVHSNPVMYTDPSGQVCVPCLIAILIALGVFTEGCSPASFAEPNSTTVGIVGFPNITISNPQDWSTAEIAALTSILKDKIVPAFRNSPATFANAVGNISVMVVPNHSLTDANGQEAKARSPFEIIKFEHRIFSPLDEFGIIHEFGHQFDWQGHESDAQKLQWRSQQFVDNPAINLNFAQCTDRLQCRNIYRDQNNGGQIYFPVEAYANAFAAYILGPSSPIKYQAEKLTIIQNDIQGVP